MRYFLTVLIFIHGLISLMGFLKAFQLLEIKQFELEISRIAGLFWLLSSVLLLTSSVFIISRSELFWVVGGTALILSQIMILWFWKDAKFGTILNVVLLVLVVINFSMWNHHRIGTEKGKSIMSMNNPRAFKTNKELPELIQTWMNYVGSESDYFPLAVQFKQKGRLRLAPDKDWLNFNANQYITLDPPSFLWAARVGDGEIMQFSGVDQYLNGKGNMNIALYGLIDVVDASGNQIDEGTAIRYLGEIVWYPWMARSRFIQWEAVDDQTMLATFSYKDIEVEGTFTFNKKGVPVLYKAMRYNEERKKEVPWRVEIDAHSYSDFEGVKIPTSASVIWEYDEGDFKWLVVEIREYSDQPLE